MQKFFLLLLIIAIISVVVDGRNLIKRQVTLEEPETLHSDPVEEVKQDAVSKPVEEVTQDVSPDSDTSPVKQENVTTTDEAMNKGNSNETELNSRFGFNFNRGQAYAMGPRGYSQSQAAGMGINVGIIRPGMPYQSLLSQNVGYANTYSTGMGAPYTFAGGRYGMGGMINSGYYGGRGQAMANSYSMSQRIPIGIDGTALYSNLKVPNKATADSSDDKEDKNEESRSEVSQVENEKQEEPSQQEETNEPSQQEVTKDNN